MPASNWKQARAIRRSRIAIAITALQVSSLYRLSEQARRQLEKTSTKFEDLSLGDRRPTQLIRRYGNLYTEGRLDALDALDDVTEMTEFADLKGKLLLTILVVSFTWRTWILIECLVNRNVNKRNPTNNHNWQAWISER